MRLAILGPLCRDRNIVQGISRSRPGGVTYYAGEALARLGVDTWLFATFGAESPCAPGELKARLVHLPAEGTLRFENEYPSADPDFRIQRAEIYRNEITAGMVRGLLPGNLDYIILGPLFNADLPLELVEYLAGLDTELVLSAQGTIRYLEEGRIIWKSPDKALAFMPYLDYVFLDENELRFISRQAEIGPAARSLLGLGAGAVVVTRGEKGSRLFLGGQEYEIRAFPPRLIADPTGAGDSYLAGFLKAVELFDSPARQGEFAAMTATLSLESEGPFSRTAAEIIERLGW